MSDFNKAVEEVLSLAQRQEVFTDDLAASEEKLLELMRQLGQGVQQLYMNRRSVLGYDKSSRPCACGREQKFMGQRAKTFQTLFGSLELRRAYYHCSHCHQGCVPYDQAQGLGSRGVSVPLAKRVVEVTQDTPFGKSQRKLKSLLGCVLSENTLRRIYEAYEPAEAKRIADKLEIHHTPKHGSWLNMAEIELSALGRQCLAQRIAKAQTLAAHIEQWLKQPNAAQIKVDWQFATADARIKLRRLYPSIMV